MVTNLYNMDERVIDEGVTKTTSDLVTGGEEDLDVLRDFYHALTEVDMVTVESMVLGNKVDVNHKFSTLTAQPWHRGWAPVHILAKRGVVHSLECITDLGADVQMVNKNGETALDIASRYGVVDCVEFLLKHQPSLTNRQNATGVTALIKAVFNSNYQFRERYRKTIRLLLRAGADPNLCPSSGITALHIAASKADEYLIRLLLKHGANVNSICSQGSSPLLKALLLRHHKVACVKLLLDAGADVNISTATDRSAIHLAVAQNENECILDILKAGADPNSQDRYSNTPLSIAVKENNIEAVRKLIEFGADVNYQLPDRKFSMLSIAISESLEDMVELLLDLGASVFTQSVMGATPLYLAAETSNLKIVKMLLRKNCDLDVLSNARHSLVPQTPLQVAMETGNVDIIKVLLLSGCELKPRWLSALAVAPSCDNGSQITLVDVLKDHLSRIPTLKVLCRNYLRRLMGGNLDNKMTSLVTDAMIPNQLRHFVLMTDKLR